MSVLLIYTSFNKCSCCEHITGDVNINLYGCVSLLDPECAAYVFFFVCVISNQSISKKHIMSGLNHGSLLHKTHIKVLLLLRYHGLICVDPYYHYSN